MTTNTLITNQDLDQLGVVLTVDEAARVLRVSRSQGYELARRYLATNGTEGLPAFTIGTRIRVPRWALIELAQNGRVVQI